MSQKASDEPSSSSPPSSPNDKETFGKPMIDFILPSGEIRSLALRRRCRLADVIEAGKSLITSLPGQDYNQASSTLAILCKITDDRAFWRPSLDRPVALLARAADIDVEKLRSNDDSLARSCYSLQLFDLFAILKGGYAITSTCHYCGKRAPIACQCPFKSSHRFCSDCARFCKTTHISRDPWVKNFYCCCVCDCICTCSKCSRRVRASSSDSHWDRLSRCCDLDRDGTLVLVVGRASSIYQDTKDLLKPGARSLADPKLLTPPTMSDTRRNFVDLSSYYEQLYRKRPAEEVSIAAEDTTHKRTRTVALPNGGELTLSIAPSEITLSGPAHLSWAGNLLNDGGRGLAWSPSQLESPATDAIENADLDTLCSITKLSRPEADELLRENKMTLVLAIETFFSRQDNKTPSGAGSSSAKQSEAAPPQNELSEADMMRCFVDDDDDSVLDPIEGLSEPSFPPLPPPPGTAPDLSSAVPPTETAAKSGTAARDKPVPGKAPAQALCCPVCLVPVAAKEMLVPKCGHAICSDCYKRLLKTEDGRGVACPNCRKRLRDPRRIFYS